MFLSVFLKYCPVIFWHDLPFHNFLQNVLLLDDQRKVGYRSFQINTYWGRNIWKQELYKYNEATCSASREEAFAAVGLAFAKLGRICPNAERKNRTRSQMHVRSVARRHKGGVVCRHCIGAQGTYPKRSRKCLCPAPHSTFNSNQRSQIKLKAGRSAPYAGASHADRTRCLQGRERHATAPQAKPRMRGKPPNQRERNIPRRSQGAGPIVHVGQRLGSESAHARAPPRLLVPAGRGRWLVRVVEGRGLALREGKKWRPLPPPRGGPAGLRGSVTWGGALPPVRARGVAPMRKPFPPQCPLHPKWAAIAALSSLPPPQEQPLSS